MDASNHASKKGCTELRKTPYSLLASMVATKKTRATIRAMPSAIEDYAMIGNCKTAALVGRDGSMDWLCLPRFDSDACFAALLGAPEHGRWQIAPVDKHEVKRRYREGTLILETQVKTKEGAATLIDFMPIGSDGPEVIRIVRGDRGRVHMRMDLTIRFDYGRTVPWMTRRNGASLAIAGPHMVVLRSSVPVRGEDLRTVSEFTVDAGKTLHFSLKYASSFERAPSAATPNSALRKTEAFWRRWISRCKYHGPWAEVVQRSLITLKALIYEPTGGMVAAPTTSLPEFLEGKRNWDYRYCWLRDATFTLLALLHAGYEQEACRWRDWLVRSVAGSADQTQIMYGVAGERMLPEWKIPWLPGYLGASPVRIGNAASEQLQLDVFGEVADVLHQNTCFTKQRPRPDFSLRPVLIDHLEQIWREPDHGIWEVRGPKQHFTHSKVMAWVAFDRAVKTVERFRLDQPVERWREIRDSIHKDVCKFAYDPGLGSFVQAYGSKEMDAALLLLPLVGFLPPSDPRIRGTVQRIEQDLLRDGFVMRYQTERVEDGLPAGEGAFLPCSFWLADVYQLMGRHSDAKRLLKRLLKLQNDVGLLSEEYHPLKKRLLGNFPQAFSHVALVNTIINLNATKTPAKQRSSGNHVARREPS